MQVLGDLLKSVVTIIVVTTFLDMLLPSGALRSFVKAIAGLFVILAVLNPLMGFVFKSEGFETFVRQQEKEMVAFDDISAESEGINVLNEKLVLDNYRMRLETQIEELAKTVEGVKDAGVQVVLEKEKGSTLPVIRGVKVKVVESETGKEENETVIREASAVNEIQPIKISLEGVKVENVREQTVDSDEEPAKKGKKAGASEEKRIEKEIATALYRYFELKTEQIQVVF